MNVPLIKQIEALGRAVDDGLITRDEAIKNLVEWSHGGLAEVGAANLLDHWPEARERYRTELDHARALLTRFSLP